MEKYFLFSSLIERLDTVKLSVVPRLIYRFNAISVKITANYFVNIDKLIMNFIWKGLRSRIANRLLKEKNSLKIDVTWLQGLLQAYLRDITDPSNIVPVLVYVLPKQAPDPSNKLNTTLREVAWIFIVS